MSETQADILALVTGAVVDTTRGNSVSGKFLRRASKGVIPPDGLAANLERLVPTHLTMWGTPQKLDDEYALTFDGLLASSHAGRAKAALLAVLRTWIAKSAVDAEFRTFSWPEVKAAMSEGPRIADAADERELRFSDFVVRLAKLAPNATLDRNVWQWTTPQNVEALMTPAADTGEVGDFIATIRAELAPRKPSAGRIAEPGPLPEVEEGSGASPGADESLTLEEAIRRVLKALVDFGRGTADRGTSRKWYTGQQLATSTDLGASEVDDAIEWLATRDLIKSLGGAGTAPFHFLQVQLRPEGRSFYETLQKQKDVPEEAHVDPRNVFVIHGRDEQARRAMFHFLLTLKLNPIEWSAARRMTQSASPYIGEVLKAAFANARGVVAVFTGDDEARLRPQLRNSGEPEEQLTPQPRQNVLFEAGMAFGSHPDQVVLVEVGQLRTISDLTGRHAVRVAKGGHWRHDIADRLETAGCSVDKVGRDWLEAGADLERLATEAAAPSSPPARNDAAIREYSVPELQRLFGLRVEERVRGMARPVKIDLREEQGSENAWSKLSIEQLKEEVHRLAGGDEEISIQSEVGAIIVMRWVRPRV